MTITRCSDSIVLFIEEQQAVCFVNDPEQPWQMRKIKGEAHTPLKLDVSVPLGTVLNELCTQLNRPDDLASLEVHFFYDRPSTGGLRGVAELLTKLGNPVWQVFRLERVWECAQQRKSPPVDRLIHQLVDENSAGTRWVRETLLPTAEQLIWGDCAGPVGEATSVATVLSASVAREGNSKEIQLQRKIAKLEARFAALHPADGELLLTFLPALYAQAYTVLGGVDLALLVGRVEPFAIPSPYPEPSSEALHRKQRDFLALPRDTQRQIIQLVSGTTKKLRPRPEMRKLIQELEDG